MLGRTFGRRFVGQGLRNTHGGPGHAYAPTVSVNESLFDPATFAATRRARDEARTLPSGCYTSPAWFAKETESIFARGWMLIGRGDEIAQPGAYLALDLPGVGPVFVTRAKDGSVRGFANVCRHRGARMLEEGRGVLKAGVVVCPVRRSFRASFRASHRPSPARTSDTAPHPSPRSTTHGRTT